MTSEPSSSSMEYDVNTLTLELKKLGFSPGPINECNENLYLKKLQSLRQQNPFDVQRKGNRRNSSKASSTDQTPPSSSKSKSSSEGVRKQRTPVDEETDTTDNEATSIPLDYLHDINTLRLELIKLGFTPGAIQEENKTLYVKILKLLRKNPTAVQRLDKTYSEELEKSLRSEDWLRNPSPYIKLEKIARADFEDPAKKWREGNSKTSFTYLLLDPRLMDNLPAKYSTQKPLDSFVMFLNSIFYIGKGKRIRPYAHLQEALKYWKRSLRLRDTYDKKILHILDIWSNKLGVICLHVFQNVKPAEAFTYEAAMIDFIGLSNLKNLIPGNYYGVVSSWSLKERRMLGVHLLYRSMQIFINEGERQLRPEDI